MTPQAPAAAKPAATAPKPTQPPPRAAPPKAAPAPTTKPASPAPSAAPKAAAPVAAVAAPVAAPSAPAVVEAAKPQTAPPQPSFLPQKRVGARTVPPFAELTLLLFGRPGVGKTRFVASNPACYFLSLEPGQNSVDSAFDPIEIKSWAQFQAHVIAVANAKKAGPLEARCCAVDIIDILSGYCRDFICQKKGIAYPPETDFGKTWKEVHVEWTKWVRAFMHSVNVVFLTHCNDSPREVTLDNGVKMDVQVAVPTFAGGNGGKMGDYLDGIVNAMGHLRVKANGRHAITFKKDARTDAKDRTDILAQLGEIELSPKMGENWALVERLYQAKAKELGFEVKSIHSGDPAF